MTRQQSHRNRLREAGQKPVTVWISAEAFSKLIDEAKHEGSNAAAIDRLLRLAKRD